MSLVIRARDLETIRSLCAADPELIHRGWRDGTYSWVLKAASCQRLDSVLDLLLELGADIDKGKAHDSSENALKRSVRRGDVQATDLLLKRGASTAITGIVNTAILADKNHLELVRLLDEHGADIHETDENTYTGERKNALSRAVEWGREDVVEYLKSRGCTMPEQPDAGEQVSTESIADEVVAYFREEIGPPEKPSLMEIVPTGISVSVHAIPSAEDRPFVTLFTTGLADHPMTVPDEMEEYARAEIYIQLPADWRYHDFNDPNWGWPQHWLRSMAQYPSQHDTWLGGPVTLVANEDPPQPLAPNTTFTTLLMLADRSLVSKEGQKIWLYRITPLYTEERNLEIREGIPALLNAFDRHDVPLVVNMNRKNVAVDDTPI